MARCLGPHCPYGWGHHDEHVAAALKGWRSRREGRRVQEAARGVNVLFNGISQVHQHKRGHVQFHHEGKFYELPTKEFQRLGREGHKLANKEARAAYRKHEQIQKDKAAGQNPKQLEMARRSERAAVLKLLKGRIKPYRNPRPKSNKEKDKYLELEEYRELPASVRNMRGGKITLDEAAEEIARDYPWLKIHSENDLIRYLRPRRGMNSMFN